MSVGVVFASAGVVPSAAWGPMVATGAAGAPSIRARHISVGARWGGVQGEQKDTTGECPGPPKNERKKRVKKSERREGEMNK